MNVLLLIDLQNDFLPGGALAVRGGDEVIPVANKWARDSEYTIASQDWHPANHGSFASQQPGLHVGDLFELDGLPQVAWPDHCIQGLHGAEFAPGLSVSSIQHIVRKGTDPCIDSYSAFFDNGHRVATGLADHLALIGAKELTVMGLATDYCVKFTVLDALKLGYRVGVVLAGCRGVELAPGDIDRAIVEMRNAGAKLIE